MAEEWYYQLDDEKVRGPVTLNFLQTAYAQGKLRSRHKIRFRESGDWKAANSFRQMVEAREKYQKLLEKRKSKKKKTGLPDVEGETDDAIEAPTEVRSGAGHELESDPWYGILTQLFNEADLMPDPFEPEDRVWFMWVGRKLGPFSFYDLVKMGQEGTLKVTDWVSHADSEDWTPLSPEAEAGAEAATDDSSDALSDSSETFSLSDSHTAMPLSDSDSQIVPALSDSWVQEGDSHSGLAVGDSGLLDPDSGSNIVAGDSGVIEGGSDSGTYGMPQAPPPGSQPYRPKLKAAPPKLPDQVPTAALAEDEEEEEEEDQAQATAMVAAQLLAGTSPKADTGDSPEGAAPGMGDSPSGSTPTGPAGPPEEKKPLVERIKEAGPRGWATMGAGAIIGLYLLVKLVGMLPASNHSRYQEVLTIYGEIQTLREEDASNAEWEAHVTSSGTRFQEAFMPLLMSPPEAGSGDYFLLEGGKKLIADINARAVKKEDYTPWFLQDLKKAAEELGYTPPEGVPEGSPPTGPTFEPDPDDDGDYTRIQGG